jgi:metal-sulfur cluster biosynthetic enzyme
MSPAQMSEQVKQALKEVMDPETGLSVDRMELIQELEVDEKGNVKCVFRPSSPVCPAAYTIANNIKKRVETVPGVKSFQLKVENYGKADDLERVINKVMTHRA